MIWILAFCAVLFAALLLRATFRAREQAAELARERKASAERKSLFDAVIDEAPLAILLLGEQGTIVFTNREAREVFFGGVDPGRVNFLSLLQNAPEPLRRAVTAERDELVSTEHDGEREIWSLSKQHLAHAGEARMLLMVKHLTSEMSRQEVETWRRIIRVMSHELNNSLAPIKSLMHSARMLVKESPNEAKLLRIVDTVAERADHLGAFLEGYAGLARIPKPRLADVPWSELADRIRVLHPDVRITAQEMGSGYFDAGQIEQVIINLLKNAAEAQGDPIELDVESSEGSTRVVVRDRGKGFSDEALRNALLPFYSTKVGGSGLGLAIAREIIESHGGRLRLRNRDGGGSEVSFRLPNRSGAEERAKLTLTRA
jgi:nitrogen fixation/metabolism regulation signal transduction histidine kinase